MSNRFMPSPEAQEDAASPENAVTILAGALASAGLGYFGGMKLVDFQGGPEALPLVFALLGPVLFVCAIYAYAQILTVGDIRAEALEAIEVANDATAKANAIMEKANAHGALEEDKRSLSEKLRTLEAERRTLEADLREQGNRLVDLSQSLESEKANAKRALASYEAIATETAQATLLTHQKALQTAKNDSLQWQRKYDALRGEVERANAENALATAEKSVKARESAMSGRVWSDKAKAEQASDIARIEELKALLA